MNNLAKSSGKEVPFLASSLGKMPFMDGPMQDSDGARTHTYRLVQVLPDSNMSASDDCLPYIEGEPIHPNVPYDCPGGAWHTDNSLRYDFATGMWINDLGWKFKNGIRVE